MVSPHSGMHSTVGLELETDQRDSEAWIGRLEELLATINRIQSGLRPSLVKGNSLRKADQAKNTGRENLKYLAKKPQYLKKDLKSGFIRIHTDYYRPVQVIDSKAKNDRDRLENRFLREILVRIRQTLCTRKNLLCKRGRAYDLIVGKRLDNLEMQLVYCFKGDFSTNVSEVHQLTVNQILQMPQSYQDIYGCYLALVKRS